MTKLTVLAAALITGIAVLFSGGTALAQYGIPPNSQFCSASTTIAQTNTTVTIQVVITNASLGPVAGQLVSFVITSHPDNTSFLQSNTAFTNGAGVASVILFTGSTPGTIVINSGCTVVVNVQGVAVVVQPTAQVQGVAVFQLPATGDAGLVAPQSGFGTETSTFLIAFIAVVLALAALAAGILVVVRKSRAQA